MLSTLKAAGANANRLRLWKNPTEEVSGFASVKALLQRAVTAVRETIPETIIIIHYAGYEHANYLFPVISNIDYDLIGISYYPFWPGKPNPA